MRGSSQARNQPRFYRRARCATPNPTNEIYRVRPVDVHHLTSIPDGARRSPASIMDPSSKLQTGLMARTHSTVFSNVHPQHTGPQHFSSHNNSSKTYLSQNPLSDQGTWTIATQRSQFLLSFFLSIYQARPFKALHPKLSVSDSDPTASPYVAFN